MGCGACALACPYEAIEMMESENYMLKDLTLLTKESVPDDADILAVIAPKTDITEDEEGKIRDFLFRRAGRGFFMIDLKGEKAEIDYVNMGGMVVSSCSRHGNQGTFFVPSSHGVQCPMCHNEEKHRFHFA